MPSLCGSAEATREWFRAFAAHSFLTCRPLRPRGVRSSFQSRTSMPTWPSPSSERLGTPVYPAIRSARGPFSGLPNSHICYSLSVCSPLLRIRLERPAFGDFYFQAFNGSVSLPVAGYNYNRRQNSVRSICPLSNRRHRAIRADNAILSAAPIQPQTIVRLTAGNAAPETYITKSVTPAETCSGTRIFI